MNACPWCVKYICFTKAYCTVLYKMIFYKKTAAEPKALRLFSNTSSAVRAVFQPSFSSFFRRGARVLASAAAKTILTASNGRNGTTQTESTPPQVMALPERL